ncbi:alpha/beta fold hydrolase [Actinomycetospora sp. OC33-EN08]|uniref:Alpha/beta fold hydrolase n=1 Tax=Actinomycetospora aurantiaca TaxID=3129233 RepID=A0ABU8MTF2_9PSEU
MTSAAPGTDRTVTAGGLCLATRRRPGPQGPPLLLVHGLGGSMGSWEPLLEALPERDVVMIDTPGMGRSELPALPLSIGALADRIADAVRTLDLDVVDVLGFSHGGTVAQELAHRHPALVRRLVLVATVAGIPWLPPRLRAGLALLSTRRYHDRAAAERDLRLLAGGRTARDPEALRGIIDDRAANPPSTRGYRYLQIPVLWWSSHLWLHTLRCRTLVVAGRDDPVVRSVNASVLAARIADSRLALLPDAGHMLLFDESQRAARLLTEFLDAP